MRSRLSLLLFIILLTTLFAAVSPAPLIAAEKSEATKADEKKDEPIDLGWKAFIAKLVEHAAWPIALLVLGYMFRENVSGILGRLLEFEGWGFKSKFREGLSDVGKKLDEVPKLVAAATGGTLPPEPTPKDEFGEHMRKLIDIDPASAIDAAWRLIEDVLFRDHPGSHQDIEGFTSKSYAIPSYLDDIHSRLLRLHSQATRGLRESKLTPADAEEYFRLGKRFLEAMADYKKAHPERGKPTMSVTSNR